jgi:4-amino-4-deoxy-L-arabinose transferase-like glycosyltransferase
MSAAPRERLAALIAASVATGASLAVLAVYLARAGALVAYPWDWSPDEGLHLDHARRVAEASAPLYPRSFVPFPAVYGPLLAYVLAPTLGAPGGALLGARLAAIAWTLAGIAAVYALVRRAAPAALALAAAALALAPFELTFWHVLIRPDGLMTTLWLLAGVALLPMTLTPGAERLSRARVATGILLIAGACLAKLTAVFLAAPLALGWLFVDRRGAFRLILGLALGALVVVLTLQWLTAGGFLAARLFWAVNPWQPRLSVLVVAQFLARAWPLLLLGLLTLLAMGDRRSALRDGAVLLVAGAFLVLPLTAKYGATWSYLVPAVPALAVAAGRLWAGGDAVFGLPRASLGAVLLATLALVLSLKHAFPLPTAEDERTARAFYTFVEESARASGGPILAVRPELAYFRVDQPVEVEGSGFYFLAASRAPGTEQVVEGLAAARYGLVAVTWPLPATGGYEQALHRAYVPVGECSLGYYFGRVMAGLHLRRTEGSASIRFLPGARCAPAGASRAGR